MSRNAIPPKLLSELRRVGARIDESREIDHASQYRISLAGSRVFLNVYASGKTSEGGRESRLKEILRSHRLSASGAKKPRKGAAAPKTPNRATGATGGFTVPRSTPRVGTDEAGKGDYFGPLVVAGVRVVGGDEALRELGVRDSKDLGADATVKLAKEIPSAVGGEENVCVVCLNPRDYDLRWRGAGSNVNRLLGEINAGIIENLRAGISVAVVDAFGVKAREYIEAGVSGVEIEARPRAEDDAAVAAASILARSRYLTEMDRLSEEAGFTLPKGSTHVKDAARRVYRERGEDGLKDLAKFHFSITQAVTGT